MTKTNHINNFDFLRLCGAMLVAISHSLHFLGAGDPLGIATGNQSLGGVGLNLFCVVSGFLITNSRNRSEIGNFARSRAMRLVPGLAVATFVLAFLMGPFVTTLSLQDYFSSEKLYYFLFTTFVLPLNQTLPGAFGGISIYGQLYSLTMEVMFYVFVGIFGGRRSYPYVCAAAFLTLCWIFIRNDYNTLSFSSITELSVNGFTYFFFPHRLGLLCLYYLLAGSMLAILCPDQEKLRRWLPLLAIIWFMAFFANDRRVYDVIEMIVFPLIVLAVGAERRFTLRIGSRMGDISYGVYIYHSAVIQLVLHHLPSTSSGVRISAALGLSMLLGWLSFHCVEKRFLARRNNQRQAPAAPVASYQQA